MHIGIWFYVQYFIIQVYQTVFVTCFLCWFLSYRFLLMWTSCFVLVDCAMYVLSRVWFHVSSALFEVCYWWCNRNLKSILLYFVFTNEIIKCVIHIFYSWINKWILYNYLFFYQYKTQLLKSDGGFLRLDLLFLSENKLRYLILRVLVCFRELILL